jgi:hypothetical protein
MAISLRGCSPPRKVHSGARGPCRRWRFRSSTSCVPAGLGRGGRPSEGRELLQSLLQTRGPAPVESGEEPPVRQRLSQKNPGRGEPPAWQSLFVAAWRRRWRGRGPWTTMPTLEIPQLDQLCSSWSPKRRSSFRRSGAGQQGSAGVFQHFPGGPVAPHSSPPTLPPEDAPTHPGILRGDLLSATGWSTALVLEETMALRQASSKADGSRVGTHQSREDVGHEQIGGDP